MTQLTLWVAVFVAAVFGALLLGLLVTILRIGQDRWREEKEIKAKELEE